MLMIEIQRIFHILTSLVAMSMLSVCRDSTKSGTISVFRDNIKSSIDIAQAPTNTTDHLMNGQFGMKGVNLVI